MAMELQYTDLLPVHTCGNEQPGRELTLPPMSASVSDLSYTQDMAVFPFLSAGTQANRAQDHMSCLLMKQFTNGDK